MADDQTPSPAEPASNWQDSLPENIREWDEVKNSDSPDKFWDQIANHRSMIGQSIRVPSEDASAEAMQEFYGKLTSKVPGLMPTPDPENPEAMQAAFRALGAPEDAAGYEMPALDDVEWDQDRVELLREAALKQGLTTSQFRNVIADVIAADKQALEQHQVKTAAEMDALQKEWGQAYDQKAGQAEALRKQFFPFIPEGQMGAETIKAMSQIADAMGKEAPEIGGQGPGKGKMTPGEAELRINEIMDNREHPFWNTGHPGHKAAQEKVLELQRMITPE